MRKLQVYMGYHQVDKGCGISVYVRNIAERFGKKHGVTFFARDPKELPCFEFQGEITVELFGRCGPNTAHFISGEILIRTRKVEFGRSTYKVKC